MLCLDVCHCFGRFDVVHSSWICGWIFDSLFLFVVFWSLLGSEKELCRSHSSFGSNVFRTISMESSFSLFNSTSSRSIKMGENSSIQSSRIFHFHLRSNDKRTNRRTRRRREEQRWIQRFLLLEKSIDRSGRMSNGDERKSSSSVSTFPSWRCSSERKEKRRKILIVYCV